MSTNQQTLTGFINTHEQAIPILEKKGNGKRLSFNFVYKESNELRNIHVIATNDLADQLLHSINKDNIKGFTLKGEIAQLNNTSYFKATGIEPHRTMIVTGTIGTIDTNNNLKLLKVSTSNGHRQYINVSHLKPDALQTLKKYSYIAIYGQETSVSYDGQKVIDPWQMADSKEKLQTKKPSRDLNFDVSQGL